MWLILKLMPHQNKQIFHICIHNGNNYCLWSEIVCSFFLLGIKTVFIYLLYKHNFWGDGNRIDDHKRRPLLLLSKPLSVFEVVVSDWWWKARTFNSFFKSSSLNNFAFVKEKKRETKATHNSDFFPASFSRMEFGHAQTSCIQNTMSFSCCQIWRRKTKRHVCDHLYDTETRVERRSLAVIFEAEMRNLQTSSYLLIYFSFQTGSTSTWSLDPVPLRSQLCRTDVTTTSVSTP